MGARVGVLWVYYDVSGGEAEPTVFILAVGLKLRNRVRIGRQVIEL